VISGAAPFWPAPSRRRLRSGRSRSERTPSSADDATLVEVGLPRLSAGRYRVFWSVIARDGHRREGSFSFLVK